MPKEYARLKILKTFEGITTVRLFFVMKITLYKLFVYECGIEYRLP